MDKEENRYTRKLKEREMHTFKTVRNLDLWAAESELGSSNLFTFFLKSFSKTAVQHDMKTMHLYSRDVETAPQRS